MGNCISLSCTNGVSCKGSSCENDFCKKEITINNIIEKKSKQIEKLEKIMKSLDHKIEKINMINKLVRKHSINESQMIQLHLNKDKISQNSSAESVNCPISDIEFTVSISPDSE